MGWTNGRGKIFFVLKRRRNGCGVHPVSYSRVKRVKWPRREANTHQHLASRLTTCEFIPPIHPRHHRLMHKFLYGEISIDIQHINLPTWAVVRCYRTRTVAAGCKMNSWPSGCGRTMASILVRVFSFFPHCWLQRLADPDPHKHDLNLSQLATRRCVRLHGGCACACAAQTDLSLFLCGVLFYMLSNAQLPSKFTVYYRIIKFINAFTKAPHCPYLKAL